ncbi:MAG TPA: M48 family metallopeptidase [Flavobacteriales bacterium]|nr:M48 family metallopeptidase [Flavobacteriales bacterium]
MERSIKAIYYDGATSRPQEVDVTISPLNSMEVVLPNGDRFQWPLEHHGMQWERTANMLRLSFGEHPRRVLLVRDELFIKSFVIRMRHSGRLGVYDRLLSFARTGPVFFFLGVAALLVCGYLWALPWAAERLVLLVPQSLDERIGDAVYEPIARTMNEDSERTEALRAFGKHVALSPSYELTYHVVDDEQVNAFALPGGHIVVFTGLLDRMGSPEELVALLAHEATHVEERHSTRMLARGMAGYLFLSLLIGDANAVIAVIAEHANSMRNMSYGRNLESEADGVGQERMFANGVDPEGMVNLLRLLEEQAAELPDGLSFLSSHPLTKDRIANATAKAKELGKPMEPNEALHESWNALKSEQDQPLEEIPSSVN